MTAPAKVKPRMMTRRLGGCGPAAAPKRRPAIKSKPQRAQATSPGMSRPPQLGQSRKIGPSSVCRPSSRGLQHRSMISDWIKFRNALIAGPRSFPS